MTEPTDNVEEPDWVCDDTPRTEPYSDGELDVLVAGVIQGIEDTAAWQDLVKKMGSAKAKAIIRDTIFSKGPSQLNEKPNLN